MHSFLDRLSSRKFLLAVGSALVIIKEWAGGSLPPQEAAALVTLLSVAYILVEGLVDSQTISNQPSVVSLPDTTASSQNNSQSEPARTPAGSTTAEQR